MSTRKRKISSRANGAKSRGPKTAEGKRISSQNALRHGLLSRTFLLNGEADPYFQQLIGNLTAEMQPANERERGYVEMAAIARWRQMRLWSIERYAMVHEIELQEQALPDCQTPRDLPTLTAIAYRALVDQSRILDVISRAEVAANRSYLRSLTHFDACKKNCERNPNIELVS